MVQSVQKRLLRLRDFWDRDHQAKAKHQYEQFQTIVSRLAHYAGPLEGKKILDLGCGKFYPLTLLFRSTGNEVIGIDKLYIGVNESWPRKYWRILRHNGLEDLGAELLLTPKYRGYYKAMAQVCPFPLRTKGVVLEWMNAENMRFADEVFDIIVSNEVFEHLPDVAGAVSEVHRVMKKGAFAYIRINLFTSPSGGHHYNWRNPNKVPPWDHLRQRRLPFTVYLNEMREREALEVLGRRLQIVELTDIDIGEGKDLLTPEIRAELRDYSEEELLKYGIAVIAQKP